jgi:hypothetical protein
VDQLERSGHRRGNPGWCGYRIRLNWTTCAALFASTLKTGINGLYAVTVLPHVTSASVNTPLAAGTFGPGTVAGGSPSVRNAFNAWLYTQIGVTIAGVIDAAACVENAPASQAGAGDGILSNLNLTSDGLHPSQLGHVTIAACVASHPAFAIP